MIRWLYSLILCLAAPLLLFGLYKKKPGKPTFGRRWKEHFGITPTLNLSEKPVWIHAVSVGEAIAATPIIKALKEQNPLQPIIVTTTTSTGAAQIEKLGGLVEHRYMPIDFSFAVRGFLKAIKPKCMLIMETELWPNTLYCVAEQSIPISVLNARLSEKSYLNYKKVKPIFDLLAQHLTQILCQYQDDADRFMKLGVAPEKIVVTGSMKFDIDISEELLQTGTTLRKELGKLRPIWIAASTHYGEDEHILTAHKQILDTFSDTLLIIVPRHPERFSSVNQLIQSQGFKTVSRTENTPVTPSTQVYLADTMGEMLTLIGASDICFMGGSLLGDKVGGHNLLEPAALGKPSLTGPSYFNFLEITETLVAKNATKVITSNDELAKEVTALIVDREKAKFMGKEAAQFVSENTGAVAKIMNNLNY